MCYYFHDIMKAMDINFGNILFIEKSYKNSFETILVYDISYKTFMNEKLLHIRFNKVNGFIKIYDGARYLVLFGPKWYGAICYRIRYLISDKSTITDSINHNFARIRIDSYNFLLTETILTFHIEKYILATLAFNKLMQNIDLTEKSGTLYIMKFYYHI